MDDKKYRILRQGADKAETKADSKMIFRGKILNLRIDEVELPDGKRAAREVVEHSGAVVIVPVLENGNILFVRQYRYPVSKFLLELPAGKLDHGDENIEDCARRELMEETHHSCESVRKLSEFYTSPGFCDEKLHLFVASGLRAERPDQLSCDSDEFISIADFPPEEALEMVRDNRITDAKTMLGILYYNALIAGKNSEYKLKT